MGRMIQRGLSAGVVLLMAAAAAVGQEVETEVMARQERGMDGSDSLEMKVKSGAVDEGVRGMELWLMEVDRVREGLQRNDGYIVSDDEALLSLLLDPDQGESMLLRRFLGNLVVAIDKVPDEFYEELDQKKGALWEEINRFAPHTGTIKGERADTLITSAVSAKVRKVVEGASVIDVVLEDREWQPQVGLPLTQYRRGAVLYTVPGQPLAVQQKIVVERPLSRAPGKGPGLKVSLGHLRFQTLEKSGL